MAKALDLTGERFGRLVAIKKTGSTAHKGSVWLCICDCGNMKEVAAGYLKRGSVKSCGCLGAENRTNLQNVRYVNNSGFHNGAYKHGGSHTRLYVIWQGMKQRCNNPNVPEFNAYGGRGITVCDDWKHDFVSFRNWATSNGYSDDLTIDRIDNDSGYRPDNCRWIPQSEQYSNMQRNYRKE